MSNPNNEYSLANRALLGLNPWQPLIVNYGMGVDSTSVLVGLHALGICPDLIIFSDTGAEKPETYEYLAIMNAWLEERGMPAITVVKYKPTKATYDNLYDNCVQNETLPSIAFRGGSTFDGGCSLKFKGEVMDAWIQGKSRGPWKDFGWAPFAEAHARPEAQPFKVALAKTRKALDAIKKEEKELKKAGEKLSAARLEERKELQEVALAQYKELAPHLPVKAIGFDDSPADRKRTKKAERRVDDNYAFIYPLQQWGWTREICIEKIHAAGLPAPVKSACFFCPSSKKWEIRWLAAKHPELFLKAIAMEDGAANGKFGLKPNRGLGINFRWREWAESEGWLRGNRIVEDPVVLMNQAMADKPAHESNSGLVQLKGRAPSLLG